MAATDQAVQPAPPRNGIPAAGLALAAAGIAGTVAPVIIPVLTASATAAGITAAATAAATTVTELALIAARSAVQRSFPSVPVGVADDRLVRRAAAYRKLAQGRVRDGTKAALQLPTQAQIIQDLEARLAAVPDHGSAQAGILAGQLARARVGAGSREEALRRVLNAERRYAEQHASAQVARAVGAANQAYLEQVSPRGAYWMRNPRLNSEKYCLALDGHFWPHDILRQVFPPVHGGCGCRLLSEQQATARGLMGQGQGYPAVTPAVQAAIDHMEESAALRVLAARGDDRAAVLLEAPEDESYLEMVRLEAAGILMRALHDEVFPELREDGLEAGTNLTAFAQRELELAGLFRKDSDYDGMLGDAVMKLIKAFSAQGHSGFSAAMTTDLFQKLSSYKNLTPLTNDPGEWMHIHEDIAGEPNLWQSRRRPDAWSKDGGKTYYCLDDKGNWEPYTDPEDGYKGRRWIRVAGQPAKVMYTARSPAVREAWDPEVALRHPRGQGGEFRALMWHGSLSRGLFTRRGVRPGFFASTHRAEAEDYADPESGELLPVTVHLRNPAVYYGSRPRNAEELARTAGQDGVVIHYPEDIRDPSMPFPARSWAIVLDPKAVRHGHQVQEAAWDSSQALLHPRAAGGKFRQTVDKLGFTLDTSTLLPKSKQPKPPVHPDAAEIKRHADLLPIHLHRGDGKTIAGQGLPPRVRAATAKDSAVTRRLGPGYSTFIPEEGDRNGLIGVGVDAKGRVKRVYSDEFEEGKARLKFERVRRLSEKLPELDSRLMADADHDDTALATAVIRVTGMRPGSARDRGGDKEAFGATTLQAQHVVPQPDGTVRLQFVGKGGKANDIHVADPAVARLLTDRAEKAGSPEASLLKTNETKVNGYVKSIAGAGYSAKDLRTALATAQAADALSRIQPPPPPDNAKAAGVLRKQVAGEVAKQLGNTADVVLKRYVDPTLWAGWNLA